MSTPVAPSSSAVAGRILAGCAIGCLLLLVLGVAGCWLFNRQVLRPAMEAGQRVGEAEAQAGEARARLATLDERFPWTRGDDLAAVVLTDEDVTRYVQVRRDLEPQLERVETAWQRFEDSFRGIAGGAEPSVGEIFGLVSGLAGMAVEMAPLQRDVLVQAESSLEKAAMGPDALGRLAVMIEWRFLRRPEALALGLPAWRREDVGRLRQRVRLLEAVAANEKLPPERRADMAARLEDARARLAEVEREASVDVALATDTVAVLEARRAELEALPLHGARLLADLEAPTVFVPPTPDEDLMGDLKISTGR